MKLDLVTLDVILSESTNRITLEMLEEMNQLIRDQEMDDITMWFTNENI